MEAFELRLWDGRLGRWLSPDPYGQYASPYLGMGNNPIGMIDPDGGQADWHRDFDGTLVADPGDNAQTLASFLGISLDNARAEFNHNFFHFESTMKGGERFSNTMQGIGMDNIFANLKKGNASSNDLDPSTIGQNLLGLTYPGGNNPKTYAGRYDYTYVPTDLSEYPAIGHDRRYDRLKIEGASGLFTDTRAIGADWKFVKQEIQISIISFNPKTKFNAAVLGVGLGLSALPKTIIKLAQPTGLAETMMWYNVSSIGVTNAPSPKR